MLLGEFIKCHALIVRIGAFATFPGDLPVYVVNQPFPITSVQQRIARHHNGPCISVMTQGGRQFVVPSSRDWHSGTLRL